MTHIKICGLRTAEHALVAAEAGADMLGLIFAPARRQVQPHEAAAISQAVRAAAQAAGRRAPLLVGVFVNETPARMLALAEQCGLDVLQLSGDEAADVVAQLPGCALVKTVRFDGSAAEQSWLAGELPLVRLHVDAHVAGAYGGSGVAADWDRAGELARARPIVLAGGLGPGNVGAAIRQVRPWGVDVSSGVETDGVKDVAKIRAFIRAARQAAGDNDDLT